MEMIDPILQKETSEKSYFVNRGLIKDSLDKFIKIALQCVAETQDQRPTMEVVIQELHGLFLQENKDDLIIPLQYIKLATENFHDNNCIGEGEIWRAYKGILQYGDGFNTIVAKRFRTEVQYHWSLGQGGQQFRTELQILFEYKHEKLISLVGYCDEKNEQVIVYEYAFRGSLDGYLKDARLTWMERLNICIDVATALAFLHGGVGKHAIVIHRDINTANILLNDEWNAKLADFGLSLVSASNRETGYAIEHPGGTKAYLDPLYLKSDIYSFGVVLFEILCGRSSFETGKQKGQFLPGFIKESFEKGKHDGLVFESLKEQIEPKALTAFQTIAYRCLHDDREERPTAKEVLEKLMEALEFQVKKLPHVKIPPIDIMQHLKIPLGDIMIATDNFSKAYQIGVTTYYDLYTAELEHSVEENSIFKEGPNNGELPRRRNTVVIKRILPRKDEKGKQVFYTEIKMHDTCKHPSIVKLLGICDEGSEMILVVEHLSNGSLANYLENFNDKPIHTWAKRLKICLDVAHVLNYLHTEMEDQLIRIHLDINCDYIALDKNWGAKFDFGASVFLPPNQDDNALYPNGNLKRELDVYCFGLVLFEVLCGRLAYDPIYGKGSDKSGLAFVLRRWFLKGTLMEMMDPILKEERDENIFVLKSGPNKDSFKKFVKIAHECIAEDQDQRPTMKVVIEELQEALVIQENNNGDPIILLEEIKQATQNFHDDNCIGGGGFGKVYKGNIRQGDGYNTIVAKRLDTRLGQGKQQFMNELQILFGYKHENLIRLVGYCDEKNEQIIVYEYASRGSLDRYLKDARLTWMKRLKICIDVATALAFLHGGAGEQPIVIHRDIKTANILLTEEWDAKLADFGLSLISQINLETDYVIDHVCGTRGYLDPLYLKTSFLTIESDIYSLGVVLFEILFGRSTYEIYKHKGQFLPGFIKECFEEGKQHELVFEAMKEQIIPKALTVFHTIAYQCLHDDRGKRPTAEEVLSQLKMALVV